MVTATAMLTKLTKEEAADKKRKAEAYYDARLEIALVNERRKAPQGLPFPSPPTGFVCRILEKIGLC